MKYLNLFSAVLLVVISSCSKDDTINNQVIPKDDGIPTTYFPIKDNNLWTYKTENTSVSPSVIGEDLLFEENEVQINGLTYQKMRTKSKPTGIYCSFLDNNALRIDGKMIKLKGEISINIGESLPVNFLVNDFVLFKENATVNEVFGKASGSFTKTLTALPAYPLTMDYVLTAKEDGSLDTFNSNGVDYTDVKKVKLVLNLKVFAKTVLGSINLLNPEYQDVMVSYQYYAKNYGLIQSDTNISYTLNTKLNIPLGTIPTEESLTRNDYLLSK
jgi:hypothetical protein